MILSEDSLFFIYYHIDVHFRGPDIDDVRWRNTGGVSPTPGSKNIASFEGSKFLISI
jgi:hypothetical protein